METVELPITGKNRGEHGQKGIKGPAINKARYNSFIDLQVSRDEPKTLELTS